MELAVSFPEVMKNKKWIRNNMGMGRMQFIKFAMSENEPVVIMFSDILEKPQCSKVKQFVVKGCNVIALYDGTNCNELDRCEFGSYADYFEQDEWDVMYEQEAEESLKGMELLNNESGVSAEVYGTIQDHLRLRDNDDSAKLNLLYNL
mgnify:CR=1 FL=1